MNNRRSSVVFALTFALVLAGLFLLPHAAQAAPGGAIATALFRTLPGKIILAILCVIFAPVIISVMVQEARAEKRTQAQLAALAVSNKEFDWFTLKNRVTEVFGRVHAAWRKEDMQEASEWMTHWYWQNQQLGYLDQWERDGLVNHCRVSKINKIRPLMLSYKEENGSIDGSRFVVGIDANMEDYLAERVSGKVVKGAPGYTDVESVWTFIRENGKWLLENIEEGALTLQYAKLTNQLAKSKARAPGVGAFDRRS